MRNRVDVEALVAPLIVHFGAFPAVLRSDAMKLLGESRFAAMVDDPIRGVGPTEATFYPWNVADYLQLEETPCETE